MSVVGVHIHFHDVQLGKLAAYLVDGYIAAKQCVASKVTLDGSHDAYQRRYHQAVKNLALMKKFLTPDQTEEILHALGSVQSSQAILYDENGQLGKKARLAVYKKAVMRLDGVIKRTSDAILGDLSANGGDASAYRMALACTSADVDAVRMMHDIMGMFENADASGDKVNPSNATQPSKAPKPLKESKPSKEPKRAKPSREPKPFTDKHRPRKGKQHAVMDPVPAALMAGMADRLMEATLS